MWDTHLNYLIKILMQDFILRPYVKYDENRHVVKHEYHLTICNVSPNGINDQGLADPEQF